MNLLIRTVPRTYEVYTKKLAESLVKKMIRQSLPFRMEYKVSRQTRMGLDGKTHLEMYKYPFIIFADDDKTNTWLLSQVK
jgi:hypothetical protein